MMLESQCIFDVRADIRAPIAKLVQAGGENDEDELNLRVVGQEQDGCLLYTWMGPSQSHQQAADTSNRVTHVGLYDPINKINKTVFVHEKLVDIVNCSISQERTFLGFVTLEQTFISEGYGRRQKQDKYQAYLAEVASPSGANRVFYLNLERPLYIRLQFLYGRYRGQVSKREAHLLVLLHAESVGLYHIPMARVGDDGVLLSGEPKKEQIFQKRFVWWQWDPTYQRLYVAQFRRQSKTSSTPQYCCYLTGYQFTEATVNEFMLDVPLDLPVPYKKSSSQRSHYESPGPHQSIPDSTVNMCVLTQNNGTFCICFQHPLPSSKSGSPTSPTPGEDNAGTTMQYSVLLVHHGKTLTCTGLQVPRIVARKCRLLFVLVGDYLVVHLDGYFTHLLNVGVDFEPCHHILWQDPRSSESSPLSLESPTLPGNLMPIVWDRHAGTQALGALVFDTQKQKGFRIAFNRETLLAMFIGSHSQTSKLAILHFSVLHQRDLFFQKRLFESILSEPSSPEIVELLEEFLVASTYTVLRRQTEMYIMRYMPFTCAATFRGQTETDAEGNRVCSLNYLALGSVTLGNLARVKADHHTAEMWGHLEVAYGLTSTVTRFSSRLVQHHLESVEEDDLEFVKIHSAEVPNLFQKLATAAKSALTASRPGSDNSPGPAITRQLSRSELVLGRPPAFLSSIPHTTNWRQEQLFSITNDLLTTHLKKFLKKDSRSKLRCTATEYIECQMQQSRHLAHLLCALLVPDDTPEQMTLDTEVTEEEYNLFLVLERYHLALEQQGYPYPLGFPLYYICLAFRCLRFNVFRQYMENHVLQPTQEFMEKLLKELPDTETNAAIKLDVLGRLTPDAGIACARLWDHPLSRRFLAIRYTDACLNDGVKEEFTPVYGNEEEELQKGATETDDSSPQGVGFPPLVTLLSAMERKVSRQKERGKGDPHPLDHRLLQEASLAQLYSSGCQQGDIITYG